MKICFIGDIHLKKMSPLNRLIDYNDDLLKKLEWIRDYCNTNEIDTVVHLGDIADYPDMPDGLKNKFIQTWRLYKGTFYSIVGMSHDLFYNNEQSYFKTCLYNLELSGILQVLYEPVLIDNIRLAPLDMHIDKAKEQIRHAGLDNHRTIFLAHQFYNWDLDKRAGFEEDDFVNLDKECSLILGHDHRQHNDVVSGNVTIRRPGSLMRTELSEETISKKPRVLLFDSTTDTWDYITVPHRDINEIYNVAEYRAKKSNLKSFKQVKNALENISSYFHKDDTIIHCSKALEDLKCPPAEYEYLKSVYQLCNQQF